MSTDSVANVADVVVKALLNKSGLIVDLDKLIAKHGAAKVKKLQNSLVLKEYIPIRNITKRMTIYEMIRTGGKKYLNIPRAKGQQMIKDGWFDEVSFKFAPGTDVLFDADITLYSHQDFLFNIIMDKFRESRDAMRAWGLPDLENKVEINEELIAENQANMTDWEKELMALEKKLDNESFPWFGCNLLKLQAGRGKTYIASKLICEIGKKALFVCPNTLLIAQTVKVLTALFPNNTIGQYYNKKKIDGDIVVICSKSCNLDKYRYGTAAKKNPYPEMTPDQFFDQFGLVIYDESHTLCAPTTHKAYRRAQSQCVLSMSATPEYGGAYKDIQTLFSGELIDAESMPEVTADDVAWKGNVEIIKYDGPDEYTENLVNRQGWVDSNKMRTQFLEDPYRTQLIIDNIKRLLAQDKNIFVFVDRRAHIPSLMKCMITNDIEVSCPELDIKIETALANKGVGDVTNSIKGKHTHNLIGGANLEDIDDACTNGKVIITTYGFSAIGVSIPKMDGLIFASPRRSGMLQIIPRILRLGGDTTSTRELIDIVDNKTKTKSQLNERKSAYKHYGFEITTSKVHWGDVDIGS